MMIGDDPNTDCSVDDCPSNPYCGREQESGQGGWSQSFIAFGQQQQQQQGCDVSEIESTVKQQNR